MLRDIEWALAIFVVVAVMLTGWMVSRASNATSTAALALATPHAVTDTRTAGKAGQLTPGATATLYAAGVVNIRSGPSTDKDVVGRLSEGDGVEVEQGDADWRRIAQGPHLGSYVYTPVLQGRE